MKKLFVVCIFVVASGVCVYGQHALGSIEGSVRDLAGHPIRGATVYAYDSAKMVGRFVKVTTISDSTGRFVLANLPQGNYRVHAYKEEDGYADTFFLFFKTNNNRAWKNVQVQGSTPVRVALQLGPKYATLRTSITDERGNPIGGTLTFWRPEDSDPQYRTGVNAESKLLVPPVSLRFQVSAKGYETWNSDIVTFRSGVTTEFVVRLRRSN